MGHLLAPTDPGFRRGCGLVLAADPAAVADAIEVCEQERFAELAGARSVSVRVVGGLDVADVREVLLQGRRQFAFHALRVEHVVLREGVVGTDVVEDGDRLRGVVQVEVRDVIQ